jgi:hypothetical protein
MGLTMHIQPNAGHMELSFTNAGNQVIAVGLWTDSGSYPAPVATGIATGIDAVNVWNGDNSSAASSYRAANGASGSGSAPGYVQYQL